MQPGSKYKVTFKNHVRRGILHGEVTEVTPYEVKLRQFTDDNMIVTIKRRQIIEFELIKT